MTNSGNAMPNSISAASIAKIPNIPINESPEQLG